jgi:hypothetical protein
MVKVSKEQWSRVIGRQLMLKYKYKFRKFFNSINFGADNERYRQKGF